MGGIPNPSGSNYATPPSVGAAFAAVVFIWPAKITCPIHDKMTANSSTYIPYTRLLLDHPGMRHLLARAIFEENGSTKSIILPLQLESNSKGKSEINTTRLYVSVELMSLQCFGSCVLPCASSHKTWCPHSNPDSGHGWWSH